MKNNYITPLTETIEVNVMSHLMDPSLTGVGMYGFTKTITINGETSSADSRGSIWGDDEEDFEE